MKRTLFTLLVFFLGIGSTKAQPGETVVINATVNTDVTKSYLVVQSLVLQPKATGPLVISTPGWYAKQIEQTHNMPPSLDKNFVRTESAIEPYSDELEFAGADHHGKVTSFTYSDGLGRPTQSVVASQSPSAKDIVAFHKYDSTTGIEDKSYLPYTRSTTNPGAF